MGGIPQDVVDRMMVKCARRCCICRRFQPTKLQVHHIVESSQGGSDEEENLVVVCMTCHSNVHSTVPFARRFTCQELKGHRDALVGMIMSGTLPAEDADAAELPINAIISQMISCESDQAEDQLSKEAAELLLAAAHAVAPRQGKIFLSDTNVGLRIFPGYMGCPYSVEDPRSRARYKAALEELSRKGMIAYESESIREVTDAGFIRADEIASSHGRPQEGPGGASR